jgi:hypothetical protein
LRCGDRLLDACCQGLVRALTTSFPLVGFKRMGVPVIIRRVLPFSKSPMFTGG